MSQKLKPYLIADGSSECLLCGKSLGDDVSNITQRGWNTLQADAKAWSEIQLKPGDKYFELTQVYSKIVGKEKAFGKRHRKNKCRANFSTRTLRESLRD